MNMCIYIFIYIYIYMYTYIFIYIYIYVYSPLLPFTQVLPKAKLIEKSLY